MKKKEKTVCQIIRFRGKIKTFFVSIDEFPSFIYFRLMKMVSFQYKISSCASKFSLALQAVQWMVLVRGGWLKSCVSKFRGGSKLC